MYDKLIPQPKNIILFNEAVDISCCYLSDTLYKYVPISKTLFPLTGKLPINFSLSADLDQEEYVLSIDTGSIEIMASTSKGAYYALCTLKQIKDTNEGCVNACRIEDRPSLELRGYSDDNSRGQISNNQNFKDIIRRLSLLKYNVYMPYIEDIIKFDCIPESGKFSDPMDKSEWKELVEYAKQYYVTIIPIVNCLGHWDKNANLQAFRDICLHWEDNPENAVTGDLDPRKPKTLDMLKDMLDEIVDVFGESGIIHLGGDEVVGLVPIFGKEAAAAHFNRIYKELYQHLKSKGIKTLMYSDMYMHMWGDYGFGVEHIDEMPKDIGFVYWDYTPLSKSPKIEELRKRKRDFYISPATMSWNRLLPSYYNCYCNTKSLIDVGEDSRGLFMSAWCDNGMNLREENWFGLFVGANFSWNTHSDISYEKMITLFFELFYGIKDFDIKQFNKLTSYELKAVEGLSEKNADGEYDNWYFVRRAQEGEKLFKELLKDCTDEVDIELRQRVKEYGGNFSECFEYFHSLKPTVNEQAYRAFLFDIKRSIVAVKKILLIKEGVYPSREAAMADIPKIEELILDIQALIDENMRIWYETNRRSEWDFVEAKYLNSIDSLRAFIRYCKYNRRLNKNRVLRY